MHRCKELDFIRIPLDDGAPREGSSMTRITLRSQTDVRTVPRF